MLNQDIVRAAAGRLRQAEKCREQVRQISLDHPEITIADAYATQREWVAMKLAEGRRVIGHKIGLTSRAMQQSSQIDEPDYGALLDDMLFNDGADIPAGRFIVPMVEVELAFILGKRLEGENVNLFDVLSATDYVIPALEIIDARCHRIDPESRRPRKVMDTISDNAANAGIVMGGRPIRPLDVDLRWVSAAALPQRPDRGNGRGRRRAQPSGQRHLVARPQVRAPRRGAGAGADHPRRVLHTARAGAGGG